MTETDDFIDRIRYEREELMLRLDRLQTYMWNFPVSGEHFVLLKRQADAMVTYRDVLTDRLKLLKEEV